MLLTIMLLEPASKERKLFRIAGIAGLVLMVFGGCMIAGPTLSAAAKSVLTEPDVSGIDARVSEEIWDRLAPGSLIFDPQGWRATMLTGRLTRAIEGNMSYNYARSSHWEAILANPSIQELLEQGYQYVYIDKSWWDSLPAEARESLSIECIEIITEYIDPISSDFRRLINLEACSP
jgi:hypothetical protein